MTITDVRVRKITKEGKMKAVVSITLDDELMYEGDKIIPAGYNVLTGEQAEWFVRYRRTFSDEGDIGRVKHQRKFLAAAMSKMLNIV